MAERAGQGRQGQAARTGEPAKAAPTERKAAAEAARDNDAIAHRGRAGGETTEAAMAEQQGNGQSVAAPSERDATRAGEKPPRDTPRSRALATAAHPKHGDAGESCGSLRVLAFAYPAADADGPFETGFSRLMGVLIRIEEQGGDSFDDLQSTDEQGEAHWSALAPGDYRVTVVDAPSTFTAPTTYYVSGAGDTVGEIEPGTSIDVPGPGETVVGIGFAPLPAVIDGVIFQDMDLCEYPEPNDQPRVGGVFVEALVDGERVGCALSDDDGEYAIEVGHPGLIELRLPLSARRGDTNLYLGYRAPLMLSLAPGEHLTVPLYYQAQRSDILVRACFDGVLDGQPVRMPIAGVTFSLYRGSIAGGTPLRKATANGPAPVVLGDLDEGLYTLCATPPARFRGRSLEPTAPNGDCRQVWVPPGRTVPLVDAFTFKPSAGRVIGIVVDDTHEVGVAGVELLLSRSDGQGTLLSTTTGPGGEFTFTGVELGNYIVSLPEKIILGDLTQWEPAPASGTERAVFVRASGTTPVAPPFSIVPEEHRIIGHVRTTSGRVAPFTVIDFFDEIGNSVGSTTANAEGYYDWLAPRAGTFAVQPRLVPAGRPLQVQQVTINSVGTSDVVVPDPGIVGPGVYVPPPTSPPPDASIATALADLTAYPLLTEGAGFASAPSAATSGGGGASAVQRVENAIRDVLGWRPKEGDTKGYLAALTQAFTPVEIEGGTVWKWTPRSYHVQADMGKITGAQASIYARAQAALDQSLPLLDGLQPLDPASDGENLDAVRAVVRSDFSELVHELGEEGGPRVARVDALFDALVGPEPPAGTVVDPAEVGGELGDLQDRFGLDRGRVNTVDEEQNLTNFLIIVDHVRSLRQSWLSNRAFFVAGSGIEPFFGTQLVLVSRALAVVAESVGEVFFAMDSVFLRSAERQTTQLIYPTPTPPIFLESLLTWVERAAADELPNLIQEGGKIGARAAVPTLQKLAELVLGALLPAQQSPTLSAGYKTARVQRALSELAGHLQTAADLAGQFSEPSDALLPPPAGELPSRVPGSMPAASSAVNGTGNGAKAMRRR